MSITAYSLKMLKKVKPKKCKVCSMKFTPQYSSVQFLCSPKCAIEYNKANADKVWQKEKKVIKDALMSLSDWEFLARQWFQKWIRIVRDINRPCLSCGSENATKWDASHYFSANQYSGLIFDEMNVHKCCVFCNQHLHGNLIEYRKGLIKRYGLEYVNELEAKAETSRFKKWTREEYQEIINTYKLKIKEYGKTNKAA